MDLAGNEKSSCVYEKKQEQESVNINQSLTTLSIVVQRLSQRAQYVNFRDSELTKLLEDALTGRSKTTLIACVNPGIANRYETVSTVRFASLAKSIAIDPKQWVQDQVRFRCTPTPWFFSCVN